MTERTEQDQEDLDVAAGPATTGRTVADTLAEDTSEGSNASGAMGAPVSAGEVLGRGGSTPAGPTSPSTGTLGEPSSDDDHPGDASTG